MQHLEFDHITTDSVKLFSKKNIDVWVLRLDKIHPVVSGNKWFKLQHYIKDAKRQGKKKIVTFGGAWSNHIVASAAACKMNSLGSAGVIRGEEPAILSPVLLQAKEYGMQLFFISRDEYDKKKIPAEFKNEEYYLVNEGGYGEKGAEGASGILQYTSGDFTHCCCAVGTGTMMAGLIKASSPEQEIIGISVLKNHPELETNVRALLHNEQEKWLINHAYHFGGYAKHQPTLTRFMNEFFEQTNIPSDFVYTGKLFFAIADMIQKDFFPAGSRLLLIHSGGLQGNASLKKGTLIF